MVTHTEVTVMVVMVMVVMVIAMAVMAIAMAVMVTAMAVEAQNPLRSRGRRTARNFMQSKQ